MLLPGLFCLLLCHLLQLDSHRELAAEGQVSDRNIVQYETELKRLAVLLVHNYIDDLNNGLVWDSGHKNMNGNQKHPRINKNISSILVNLSK